MENLEVGFIKVVIVGSVNPNKLLSPEELEKQAEFLNKCLSEYPKGRIIGKNTSIGKYKIGEHELIMEQTAYHIGFKRKPEWLNA